MDSLKEWATVIKALEDGKQTVLLRKGGILDVTSGFKIESKKFLLFPTFEHQEYDNIKPQFHHYLEKIKQDQPKEGYNTITSYAEILAEKDISSERVIQDLSSFHIWSDSYINTRKNWKPEKPIKVVFLRVYRIPTQEIPLKPEYQGCKSWININDQVPVGVSVLSDEKVNSELEKFKEIIK